MCKHTHLAPVGASEPPHALDEGIDRRTRRFHCHKFPLHIERRLKALAKVSAWRSLAALAEDWALIALGGATAAFAVHHGGLALLLAPPAWLLVGARMRALATLLHEASHKILARPMWLNTVMGTLGSGWWVLQLLGRYTHSHVHEHHPRLTDPTSDPDAQQYDRQHLLEQDPERLVPQNLLLALVGAKTLVNLPYLLRDRLLPKPGAPMTPAEMAEAAGFLLAWALLLAALAANGWLWIFVAAWLVPYATTFQAINWVIELSEHFPLHWTRNESFQRTRNRKGPLWERFLFGAHGEGWHRVHHERPYLQFWVQAKAHKIMMEDPAYAAFEAESGGLFTRGPNGEPSVLEAITSEMRRRNAQQKEALA